MGILTMTVASIVPSSQGKTRSRLVGEDGVQIGIFADKLHMIKIGQTYEIVHTDGQYQNVQTATLVPGRERPATQPLRAVPASPAPPPAAVGAYGNVSADTAERIFVCGALNAALQSGQVQPTRQSVGVFVNVLRGVWRDSLGDVGVAAGAEPQYRARG